MTTERESAGERTPLLHQNRLAVLQHEQDQEAQSIISSSVTKEEQQLAGSTVGERLPYNDYTTIDWLHDLVKDSYRFRYIQSRRGLRYKIVSLLDACSGWFAVVLIGALTACVAFVVDVAVATVSDWKMGYCTRNPWLNHERCCATEKSLLMKAFSESEDGYCEAWHAWSSSYSKSFGIYVGLAVVFGTISSSATMLTRSELPSASSSSQQESSSLLKVNGHTEGDASAPTNPKPVNTPGGKVMYMASGSGIPEIKTILSGFSIPSFLSLRVLLVKAFGAVFAVSTGMCLGKEGPFVHISTCVGYLVGMLLPKYRDNGRKMRELLSAACSSGLSVAFGAPIGGVLFSYEEISTYFPRKVLWRAFLCSLTAAMVLKELNPTGTGKLVLFESSFSTDYQPIHYLIFILLGVAGGVFGGIFCKLNFLWSKWFRSFKLIKQNPVLEVILVVLATTLLQFPNPLTREPGDVLIKSLLIDCSQTSDNNNNNNNNTTQHRSYICANESDPTNLNTPYILFLLYGTFTKLVLTIITFGVKVPSGVIIPALSSGALFGRLIGLLLNPYLPTSLSPALFALVGSAAFLAGVSRMTISLAVIMFELTSSLPLTVPNMLAILTAKWIADAISAEGVYDLAQAVLGHPFLDSEVAMETVRRNAMCVDVLIPPKRTMDEITVSVAPNSQHVPYHLLKEKLAQLRERGLLDAGLVLVQSSPSPFPSLSSSLSSLPKIYLLQGYISQAELAFGLEKLKPTSLSLTERGDEDFQVRVLGSDRDYDEGVPPESVEIDLTPFVDRTPLTICDQAPLEYAVEMFAKLGLKQLCVVDQKGGLVGVIIKKRMVAFLEQLKEDGEDDA